MNKITENLSTIFTAKQIQVLKDAWRYGAWGDAQVNFREDKDRIGFGACTNDAKDGGHFTGRQISGIMSGISKKITETNTNMVASFPDWWGDGSGDMVFFNVDVLCSDLTEDGKEWEMMDEWARSND